MSFEEKSAWIMGVVAVGSYGVYLAIVLGLAGTMPLVDVPYVAPLLWTVGASIALSIALHILMGIFSPKEAGKKDQRDREIYRFGEYIGQSFLVIGESRCCSWRCWRWTTSGSQMSSTWRFSCLQSSAPWPRLLPTAGGSSRGETNTGDELNPAPPV